ncbi:hypothetical protein ABIE66_004611 [Peribacillus sp. B2I2]
MNTWQHRDQSPLTLCGSAAIIMPKNKDADSMQK